MQDPPVRLGLAPPRVERRLLCPRRRVLPAPVLHVVEKLPAPGRERVQHGPLVARDLEPRHPAHQRRHRGVADLLQTGPKLVAVVGPDQQLRAFHRGELGAPPAPVPATRHVGDHRMRVQLRVEVAARQVTEGRRRHAVGLHPRCSIHLRDALGGDLRLPPVFLGLPGGRLRQPTGRVETLVEGFALRPQRGGAFSQHPCGLRRPVPPRGQFCRLRERAACVLDSLRQCRRLTGERLCRFLLRPRCVLECVDPGRRRPHRLKNLPDGIVVRTGLR